MPIIYRKGTMEEFYIELEMGENRENALKSIEF